MTGQNTYISFRDEGNIFSKQTDTLLCLYSSQVFYVSMQIQYIQLLQDVNKHFQKGLYEKIVQNKQYNSLATLASEILASSLLHPANSPS